MKKYVLNFLTGFGLIEKSHEDAVFFTTFFVTPGIKEIGV